MEGAGGSEIGGKTHGSGCVFGEFSGKTGLILSRVYGLYGERSRNKKR